MMSLNLGRHALSLCITATLLAGCGGNHSTAPQLPAAFGAAPRLEQQNALIVFRMRLQRASSSHAQATHTLGPTQRQQYKIRLLGTLGGSVTFGQGINERGQIDGGALVKGDQSLHAFRWTNGVMRDLGSLQGGPWAITYTNPNERGDVAGYSNTQTPDPNGEDFCLVGNHLICLGFLWKNGTMMALPTLGGNNGQAYTVNKEDHVVGVAENSTPDSTCGSLFELEAEPVIWHRGTVQELPIPSGDVDGWGYGINDRDQIVGSSGTCFASWPVTAAHALLWPNGPSGSFIDLGNLGSTNWNLPFFITSNGEVVGMSGVPGGYNFHAFLWTKKSGMRDLGTLPGDIQSWASDMNSQHQIVGTSFPSGSYGQRGFIWQNGRMTDLNMLVGRHPQIYLTEAFAINDQGWIAGWGNLANGNVRAYVLYPCDEGNILKSNDEGC